MITKEIIISGIKIGEVNFPDGTSESEISERMASYQPPSVDPDSYKKFSIKQRKEYADELLERFKLKNINEGINALQGMWMHHKLRDYTVNFMGITFHIDIMNLAISGDLEIACISLLYGETDDMSLPYHWLSASRKAWLITELKSFLGWA